MDKLSYFQFVQDCHTMRSMGYHLDAIAIRLAGGDLEAVRLALESSPVGSSPQG
jgi:hypothetical protein